MTCPPLAIYDMIRATLASVAPTYRGRKYLSQQDAPRRYVWVFTGEESTAPSRVGGNAKSLHNDLWSIDVHCWGRDFEEAYRLRQALIAALRRNVAGANYRLGRTTIVSDEEHTAYGDVFVVGLTLVTPLADARIEELVDDVRPEAQAHSADIESADITQP